MGTTNYDFPTIDPTARFDGANDINKLAEAIDTSMKQVEVLGKEATYTLPAATKTQLGGVRIGANVNVAADGTISTEVDHYVLPAASETTLGGVKVPAKSGITLDVDGTISIDDGSVTVADNSIGTAQLKDGAVSSAKLADGAVTYEKCAQSVRTIVDAADSYTSGNMEEFAITRLIGDANTLKAYTWGPCIVFDFTNFKFTSTGNNEWQIASAPTDFSGSYVGFSGELLPVTLQGVAKGYVRMGWASNKFTITSNGNLDAGEYSVTGRYVMLFTK